MPAANSAIAVVPPVSSDRPWLRWALILLAILPYQMSLVRHLTYGDATGFLQYDSAYYFANGREIFERGNGFAYPNPFDPAPGAPVIYFQWLVWLFGVGIKFLQLDPGAISVGVGLVASVACSAATLRLVEIILPDKRGRLPLFLLTMWGGGVLCLGAMLRDAWSGQPPLGDLFGLDVGEGWWFSNWGRNLILPTEAVYHFIVALAWIGVLWRRWGLALGAVAALAATHPFSGLQQLLIVGAWLVLLAVRERAAAMWGRVGITTAMAGAFAAYYFWYLPSFAAHRQLTAVWVTVWPMPLSAIVLAVLPAALVAGWSLFRRRGSLSEAQSFLLVSFAVTFLLLKHDWIVAPHQPAHFSRGYHWLPVWLLALPTLQAWMLTAWDTWRRPIFWGVGALTVTVMVTDNACFLARERTHGEGDRLHLTVAQREVFRWMDRAALSGVLLCSDTRLSYLSAVYTSVRPYYGHLNNTPDVHARWRDVAAWQRRGESGAWMTTIDYQLIDRHQPPLHFGGLGWRELYRNADYLLLARE